MSCGIMLVSESILDYVTAVIFAGFLAERFFVVSTRGLFRKCAQHSVQRTAGSRRVFGAWSRIGPDPVFQPLSPTSPHQGANATGNANR